MKITLLSNALINDAPETYGLSTIEDYTTLKLNWLSKEDLKCLSTIEDYTTLKPACVTKYIPLGLSTIEDYTTLKQGLHF